MQSTKMAGWKEFDLSEGFFITQLSSTDTIVLRCNSVSGGGSQRMFCIETATVSGPVYETWPPKTHFTILCKDIDTSASYVACQNILKRVAEKLFRSPVSDAELEPFYKHAKKRVRSGPQYLLRPTGGHSRNVMFSEVHL